MVENIRETSDQRLRRCGFDAGLIGNKPLAAFFDQLDLSDLDLLTVRDLLRHLPGRGDPGLAVLLGGLTAALSDGSLCLVLDRQRPETIAPVLDAPAIRELLDGFFHRLDRGVYDGLIDRTGCGFSPLVIEETDELPRLYFQRFYHHEKSLKNSLLGFLALPESVRHTDDAIDAVVEELYTPGAVIRSGGAGQPIARDPFQEAAIRAALTRSLLIVSGGPGTGKTSLLGNMLRALVRSGTDPARILLAAPTGRAALRMSEALIASLATVASPAESDRSLAQLRGSTLHKLLIYRNRSNTFLHGRLHPLDADVVAVDEVSMVDVVMMDRLFEAIDPQRTRVILIGDKDQLPSVDAGSVLADLSPAANSSFSDHFVELTTCYRSGGQLLDLARAINAGQPLEPKSVEFDEALQLEAGHWAFVDSGNPEAIHDDLDRWIRYHYIDDRTEHSGSYVQSVARLPQPSLRVAGKDQWQTRVAALFMVAQRCRILSLLRRGPKGTAWLNRYIAATLQPQLDPGGDPGGRLFNGALIMITRNDYERGLFNGDVGIILRHPDGIYIACFKRYDGLAMFPAASLPDWDLAFAMTVHKSQGSEFEDTWLILPDDPGHRLLTREIVYTAATRASRRQSGLMHG